jgi:hypothetical protein
MIELCVVVFPTSSSELGLRILTISSSDPTPPPAPWQVMKAESLLVQKQRKRRRTCSGGMNMMLIIRAVEIPEKVKIPQADCYKVQLASQD